MTGSGPLTLGTAGHVDHGKTTLVAALTGVDTDRLPEEKARGLTIALGYAPLRLPSGRLLSLVDVPGHERFVRTMVSGATGIDAFLMTIAADDGVMPQTREHAEVLRSLGVEAGVVAVTKADAEDPSRAVAEARELLPGREVVPCSARTGAGLDELTAALERLVAALPSRAGGAGPALLHVDRVFTVVGRGTVVTGTLWAGAVATGDTLEIVPRGETVRVRGVEVHDTAVERARAGQRVALNLVGVRVGGSGTPSSPRAAGGRTVARGDALAAPGTLAARTILDCALDLRDARHGERVHVHHGTRDAPARLSALADDLWQVRLEQPLLARDGDRLVIRRLAPPDTLGGGTVLDAAAGRHGRRPEIVERLRGLRELVAARPGVLGGRRPEGVARGGVAAREGAGAGLRAGATTSSRIAASGSAAGGGHEAAAGPNEIAASGGAREVDVLGEPQPDAATRNEIAASGGASELDVAGGRAGAGGSHATLQGGEPPALDAAARALARRLLDAGPQLLSEAQLADERAALRALREAGVAVRVSGRLYGHAEVVARLDAEVVALLEREGETTLAGVRDALGISRKSAQAFLEHLDATRVTRRLPDDRRVLFRREPIA